MIDLLLTPSGDLSFIEEQHQNKQLKIDFYKSKNKALRVTFFVEGSGEANKPSAKSLAIHFNILTKKANKKALLVTDNKYLTQQVTIRLQTALGELPQRTDIGSRLETVRHKNLNSLDTISSVEQIVSEAIKDILDDYTVKATPKITKENGYKQIMNVDIYKSKELLLNYELEG